MTKRMRSLANRSFLFTLSVTFVSLGAYQIGTNMVFADQGEQNTPGLEAGEGGAVFENTPEYLVEYHRSLQKREERVTKRELETVRRERAQETAAQEIEAKLKELVAAEERLRATIALADGAAERDLEKLTKVYENMKPKAAAALFSEMDPDFAAGFLSRMQPAASASVLAGMDPKIAYEISLILAARNSKTPTR